MTDFLSHLVVGDAPVNDGRYVHSTISPTQSRGDYGEESMKARLGIQDKPPLPERPSQNKPPLPERPSTNKHSRNLSNPIIPPVNLLSLAQSTDEQTNGVASMDPLSQHIYSRTSTHSNALRRPGTAVSSAPLMAVPSHERSEARKSVDNSRDSILQSSKEKRKGSSFLSRFIPGNKKKDVESENTADDTEKGEERPEGADAQIFYQPIDNLSYNPRFPRPPAYIKVRSHNKKEKEFNKVFLAQELRSLNLPRIGMHEQGTAVWALEFSKDGKYLASTGQDHLVRVWAVLSSPEERRTHEKEEEATKDAGGTNMRLSAPVFRGRPVRTWEGHTGSVLDLSWSKNNFLLSSSMDKTVRLWHISRSECLCAFKHSDFVTSIQFHPRDDRFFLAGSLDSKLRLWSIPDKSVAFWNQLPDMITAVSFTPDGKCAIAGCLSGLCLFYETEGLKYQTQIHVKSAHGKNARGSKITGIQTTTSPPGDPAGEIKFLVTSNDSRVRLYNFRDKGLEMKFKGNENTSSQIRARFSDDARYIVCGSEDKKVYIWTNGPTADAERRDRHALEVFEGSSSMATASAMAPVRMRQLLSMSEDPVYDVCNPPPVRLLSRSEAGSVVSLSRPPTDILATPTPPDTASQTAFRRPEHSVGYITRTAHSHGNVIVTADSAGVIKVFRQDCAHEKRRLAASGAVDGWETSSLFSRRRGVGGGGGSIGHTSGIVRKASLAATQLSGRSRAGSTATQPPGERILSWRQTVAPSASADRLPTGTAVTSARSVSPRKPSSRVFRRDSRSSSIAPSYNAATTEAAGAAVAGAADAVQCSSDDTAPPPPWPARPRLSPSDAGASVVEGSAAVATTASQARPQPARGDSDLYFRRDAWQDGVAQQARAAGARIAAERGAMLAPSADGVRTPRSALTSEQGSSDGNVEAVVGGRGKP